MPFPFASPDRLLASYRRTGDPRTLGRLFDKTAGELLRIAAWLCGNRADAEDLLQRTFLTVLESRTSYDPSRRAMPWLCGVLGNHARKLHEQRQRRALVTLPAAEEQAPDPLAAAAAAEFATTVARLRAELGPPYAEVLDLHLRDGLDANGIAERLGRPAGTVRTQIVRGLALLRRRLPHGFGAGLVLGASVQAASLTSVRAAVMAHASAHANAIASSAGAAVMTFGGIAMGKKLVWLVPILALVLGSGAFWWQQRNADAIAPQEPTDPATATLPADELRSPKTTTSNAALAATERAAATTGTPPADRDFATVVVHLRWADDHTPAANVGVVAMPQPGSLLTEREGVTDAQGRLVLERIRPGSCWITSSFTEVQKMELAAATETTLDIEASRVGTISGAVVDRTQRPVPDARLWMSAGGFRGFEVARSDAAGRFQLPFVAMQGVGARKTGFAPSQVVLLSNTSREVTLVLAEAGGTIQGRVVDGNNLPVPGARIEIGPPGGRAIPGSTLADRLLEPTAASLVADDAGAFTCEGVAVGAVTVQAWAYGFGPTSAEVVVDSGRRSEVVVVLSPGAVVTGRVLDATGLPVAGAVVARVGRYFEFARPRTESGPDGVFRLEHLPSGSVTLSVDCDVGGLQETVATSAGSVTSWNPVIPAESAPLHGRVIDVDGKPMPNLHVGILPPESPHIGAVVRTDAEGTFALRGADPGTHTLQIEFERVCLARREITVPAAAPLLVKLTGHEMPTSRIQGRVVDETGAGIVAVLTIRLPNWRSAPSIDADVDGSFGSSPLPEGRYLVEVTARGFGTTNLGVVQLARDEVRSLPDIVLARAGNVDIELADGASPRGAILEIARIDGVVTTSTLLDGNRASAELQPGDYLALLHADHARAATTFTVRSGERTRAILTFVPAIRVTLSCARGDADPDDLLRLAVRDAAGELLDCVQLHPGIEPAAWTTLLPPGPCTATVHATNGRTATTTFVVRSGNDDQRFALDLPPR
ncbi:MAG: sigma-70 family RNA polymerase sigma factor [Planctomycetes bacterium]|nr:sigma-70 family RNA polymerase sigma factor [Planctomycetota bacterium]